MATKYSALIVLIFNTGIDPDLAKDDILQRLQNKLNVSFQKAQEYFEMLGKQTV